MKYLILFLGLVLSFFLVKQVKPLITAEKKNSLLFLNLCSLRSDRLAAYGGNPAIAPEINKLAEKGIVFENYITRASWVNFNMGFYPKLMSDPEKVKKMRSFFPWSEVTDDDTRSQVGRFYANHFRYIEYFEKIGPGWEKLTAPLLSLVGKGVRFHHNFLLKMVHFPYSPEFREDIPYNQFLSSSSMALYQKYLRQYLSGELGSVDKLPVTTLLFGDRKFVTSQVSLSEKNQFTAEDPLGVMNNESYLRQWKNSSGFQEDLVLLNEAYNAKVNFADKLLKPFLNDTEAAYPTKNTIVILAADHGTAFMEHGNIHNGHVPFDELIKVPLIIRFPGLEKQIRVKSQVSETDLQNLIFAILEEQLTLANIESYVQSMGTEIILSIDCPKRHISVRSNQGWKLIKDLTTFKSELYNLNQPDGESRNVLIENIEVAKRLESEFITRFDEIEALKKIRCPNLTAGSNEHTKRMIEKNQKR